MSGPAPSRTRGGWADFPGRSRKLGPQALFVEPPPTAVAPTWPRRCHVSPPPAGSCDWGRAKPFGEAEATENPAAVVSPAVGEMHWGWACMVVLMMMVCGQTLRVCSPKAAAFCGLVLVFGSKLVSCDAAGLPFGMVSEPRRRLEPTLAGSLVEYLAVKMYFRVSAEFLELCQRASTSADHRKRVPMARFQLAFSTQFLVTATTWTTVSPPVP